MALHILRICLGWLFLVLGVLGMVLPILQGWLFLGLGIMLLAPDLPLFARMVCWIETRFPHIKATLDRLRQRMAALGATPPPCPPTETAQGNHRHRSGPESSAGNR